MQSFTAIPSDDIIAFLQSNNISPSSDVQQNYLTAWDRLRSDDYRSTPSSIADWIIAINLATSNIHLPPMKFLDILAMSDIDLQILTNQLTLPTLDKERFIRILRYSNALLDDMSILENLPDDVLFEILVKLDCKSIPLVCKSSSNLSHFCQRNLNNLLRQNLTKTTGLNTYDYNKEQLINLCQSSSYIKNMSTGDLHSLILTNTGQIYVFGSNEYGQLGLSDNIDKNVPTLIPNLNQIVQIAAGFYHSLALSDIGQIYAFGHNDSGQLGLRDHRDRNILSLITKLNHMIQIAAGSRHSLVLSNNGQIYACGNNYNGQLGLGHYDDRDIPTLIHNLINIKQIVAGAHYSLVLLNTGQIYAFGNNNYGRLGLGDNDNRNIPSLIPNLINIVQITAGAYQSLVLSNTGQIYAFGYNNAGQLGLGDNDNRDSPTEVMSIY